MSIERLLLGTELGAIIGCIIAVIGIAQKDKQLQ